MSHQYQVLAVLLALMTLGFGLGACTSAGNDASANANNTAVASTANTPRTPDTEPDRTPDDLPTAAEKIITARACRSCHRPDDADANTEGPVQSPPLNRIAERRPEAWIRSYLREPYVVRANQLERMPQLNLTDVEIDTLTRYLILRASDNVAKLPKTELKREEKINYARMITGRKLFIKYNCMNCHSLGKHQIRIQRDEAGKIVFQPSAERAPDLTKTHTRVRPEWLKAMLTHPPTWMPWSRMPELDIEEEDIEDLAWYIMNFRQK